ncbi:MAG: DUF5615 family PIN-like protein [Candidatus Kariarchaeaceae archaeon]
MLVRLWRGLNIRTIQHHKFLIDENVDIRVAKIFQEQGIEVLTIRDLEMLGLTDNPIVQYLQENDPVLVTHDKGFGYRWRIENLRVLLLSIHPTVLSYILPRLNDLLLSSDKPLPDFFLIELSRESIIYHTP